jgi:hypothetical protein
VNSFLSDSCWGQKIDYYFYWTGCIRVEMSSTISNFPQHVAIYRPAENGYQVLFIAEGKFQVLMSSVSDGVWFHVGKSKEFPQDDMFQIVRPSGPNGKEVYYWPTGFELVRNVPKSWPKGPLVCYPIFQFLNPPVGLSHTVIPAVASGQMNKEWASAMKVIRSAATLEQREFKDMPALLVAAPIMGVPVYPTPSPVALPPLEDDGDFADGNLADDEMPPLETGSSEEIHWASLELLMEAAKRIWWQGWRTEGPFRKRVRILDLDMLEPMEFLHYLRLVSSVNMRAASSGGKQIALKFTSEEVEKMKTVNTEPVIRDEIVEIMSKYIV